MILTLFILVVVLAFMFGLTNGFIDGGGLVSTVITTRTLEPFGALMLVAGGELLGVFLLGQAVAHVLAQRLVIFPASTSTLEMLGVLASALLGALVWNTGMWRLALPSSSSHALVGGLAGAFLMEFGSRGIHWHVFIKIFIFLGIVPLVGALLGFVFARITYWIGEFLTPAASGFFRVLQILAMAGTAMVHGSNDGQKSLAMMLLALLAMGTGPTSTGGLSPDVLPWPILLLCGGALALGIVFGSRRIIQTLGKRLFRVEGLQGFCAETSTMLLVGASSLLGYPMSTTHVMSTSVLGAGVAIHPRGVRWNLVGDIALVWLVTIPSAAGLAAVIVKMTHRLWPGY